MSDIPDRSGASKATVRSAVGVIALMVLVPALLFLSAGTLSWPMAWAWVVLSTLGTGATHLLVARRSPDTLEERARGFRAEGTRAWDRWLLSVVIWGTVAMLVVAGWDHRSGWSRGVPLPSGVVPLVLAAVGYVLSGWAMLENRFFSATVRIQRDRGHRVVSTGPYRWIRHPGYAGSLLATVCVPLILGSAWAGVPAGIVGVALIVRTALEDRVLRRELEGYEAFAGRTRHRLIPGIW